MKSGDNKKLLIIDNCEWVILLFNCQHPITEVFAHFVSLDKQKPIIWHRNSDSMP